MNLKFLILKARFSIILEVDMELAPKEIHRLLSRQWRSGTRVLKLALSKPPMRKPHGGQEVPSSWQASEGEEGATSLALD